VETKPGPSSNILVRGRPNAQQIAGADAGVKLLEVRRLADKGQKVTVIGDRQFWKLVESAVRLRKTKRARKRARRA
jgi:hypothetical protein